MKILSGIVLLFILVYAISRIIFTISKISSLRKKRQEEKQMTSLLLLLKQPRQLTDTDVRDVISRALKVQFDPDNKEATEFVLEMPSPASLVGEHGKSYMVKIPQGIFFVHNAAIPYEGLNDARVLEHVAEGRLQRVLREHQAWLSCDLLKIIPDDRPEETAYPTIGAIIAACAGEDCLGVLCPALHQCNEYSPDILSILQSEHPLALFEHPTNVPVINIDKDDPELQAAAEKARRRWSEFVAAFHTRSGNNGSFSVKASFTEGEHMEWMWLHPVQITDTAVTGALGNDPNELTQLKLGDTVTVPIERISDWLYFEDEQMIGGFSVEVVKKAMEKQ